jgi:hypothetical protein
MHYKQVTSIVTARLIDTIANKSIVVGFGDIISGVLMFLDSSPNAGLVGINNMPKKLTGALNK